MSTLRKLERNRIKNNIKKDGKSVKRAFENDWKTYRENKYIVKDEDGNIISNTMPKDTTKKKQIHYDNMEQYKRLIGFFQGLNMAGLDSVETDKNKEVVSESVN